MLRQNVRGERICVFVEEVYGRIVVLRITALGSVHIRHEELDPLTPEGIGLQFNPISYQQFSDTWSRAYAPRI